MPDTVTVKVPASTANLGSGFDAFGLALQIFLEVEMGFTEQELKIVYSGEGEFEMPLAKSNLIYKVASQLIAKSGKTVPNLSIKINNPIPLGRGLGSSGAAIIAGLLCANKLIRESFSQQEVLHFAPASRVWERAGAIGHAHAALQRGVARKGCTKARPRGGSP